MAMADGTPSRKSARSRVPNRKYSTEAIEILNDILNSSSDAEVEPPPGPDSSEDEDFRSDVLVEGSEAEEEIASQSDTLSDRSEIPTPMEELEGSLSYADPDDLPDIDAGPEPLGNISTHVGLGGSTRNNRNKNPDSHLHCRGVPGTEKDNSKISHIRSMIGTDLTELQNFALTRERWTQDSTLPTHKSDRQDKGGMGLPFGLEQRNEEATAEWNWYHDHGGKEAIRRTQKTQRLDVLQVPQYIPRSHSDYSFLMGPYGSQNLCSLKVGEAASLEELWHQTAPRVQEADVQRNHKGKKGWMLNVGSKIQCLEWAPGHAGKTQYLALAPTYNPPAKLRAPTSFEPSEPYPACIQLWAFSSSGEPYPTDSMSTEEPPQLVQLLCTRWGSPRQFRWCPVPRAFPSEGSEEKIFVGLLAGVWSDGYVRVLDLQLERNNMSSSSHVLYKKAAFASLPPTTICTCLTWLSPTELAVGCASGFVAIWDISEAILSSTKQSLSTSSYPPPEPHFYHSLHQSYILSLSSASPQCQNFLASTSIDGYLRLTDIRAPTTDFVLSLRTRNMPPAMDYHPFVQCFLASEENDYLRALPLRRLFSLTTFARAEGHVIDIRAGKVHASVLVGAADGSTMVTNPMGKVINPKGPQWQLGWFKHEWLHKPKASTATNGVDEELSERGDEDESYAWQLPRPGISRITEGFKIDSLSFVRGGTGRGIVQEGAPFSTIYEEESAVTRVCWNPNLHCGGWAAAGMGSGLVRVEDLAT